MEAQQTIMNSVPLAERMRPTSLDDYIGQSHILSKGKSSNQDLISVGAKYGF